MARKVFPLIDRGHNAPARTWITMKEHPLTILVVEDQSDQLEMMQALLKTLGHHVLAASTGIEALDHCVLVRPDFVLLDIDLPDLDGYSVARLLRKEAGISEAPIWALTSDDDDLVKRQAVGIDGYIRKPLSIFRLAELLNTVA